MKATAKDLRFHAKELLETVNRGEEVIITYRGKACAKLVPFEEPAKQHLKNTLFGIWKDNDEVVDVDAYIRKIRQERF